MPAAAGKQAPQAAAPEEEPEFDPTLDSMEINYARVMSHVFQVASSMPRGLSACLRGVAARLQRPALSSPCGALCCVLFTLPWLASLCVY